MSRPFQERCGVVRARNHTCEKKFRSDKSHAQIKFLTTSFYHFIAFVWSRYVPILMLRPMWKIPLFPIHRPGKFFSKSRPPEKQILMKKLFLSSLQSSLGLPVTSFFKIWTMYIKTITLNLEHTFFWRETFIHNDVSESFFLVERHQLNLIETKNILGQRDFHLFHCIRNFSDSSFTTLIFLIHEHLLMYRLYCFLLITFLKLEPSLQSHILFI